MYSRRSGWAKSYIAAGSNFPTSRPVLDEKHVDKEATMTIVVTGATGNVGRPLVSRLAAAGARVRAVTRTPEAAGFPDGVEAVSSAVEALPGASAVFLELPRARRRSRRRGGGGTAERSHQAGRAVGHQRRRRLRPAAVARSRRPQQGSRATLRRLRPGVGEPAAVGVRDELRRHVVGADPVGRRRRRDPTPRPPARRSSRPTSPRWLRGPC